MAASPPRVGRYRLLQEVARGGMGVVWRASGPDGRAVALKLLLAGQTASAHQRRRAATEIQLLLRLRHPHLVALLDAGEHEGIPFLVMEWVEGTTLARRLAREGPLDPRQACALVVALAGALEHCHAQGVLHRDLKPDNVLLRGDGAPLLSDFGLSKDVASEERTSLTGTRSGCWLGTPGWWPPEQARGELRAVGPRSDVYGLGAILYAALTGFAPQEGETIAEQLLALTRPPVPPGRRRAGVPGWLDRVCLRALASDPAGRQATPGELAQELQAGPAGAKRVGRAAAAGLLLAAGLGAAVLVATRAREPSAASPMVVAPAEKPAPRLSPALVAERDAALTRASVLLDAGDTEGALVELDRALTLDPGAASIHANRGLSLANLGRHAEAIADYDRALALDPTLALALYNRGNSRAKLGQDLLAIDDYGRAIGLGIPSHLPWFNRGNALSRLGRHAEAIADFDRVLAHEPDDVRALVNRGIARAGLNQDADALPDFDRAIALAPRDAPAHFNRGNARARLGRRREAVADYDRAIELDPSWAQAWSNRGLAHAELGQPREAIADYDRALRLDPGNVETLVNRGIEREAQGQAREAVQDYRRALELAPDASWAAQVRERAAALEAQGR